MKRVLPAVLLALPLATACTQSLRYSPTCQPACKPVCEMAIQPAPLAAEGHVHHDNPPPDSREQYAHTWDNKFVSPLAAPLSTFSVDVDTAAYANMRRFVAEGRLPPPDAVRIEEFLNTFAYDYAPPSTLKKGETPGEAAPFAVHTEVCACPWTPGHKLLRIGIKGAEVDMGERPTAHLTFLIDVSGSMMSPDKLPLAKAALVRLLAQLRPDDHVSLVVYAGSSGCVLENAPCADKNAILAAIDRLEAGGSTAGAQGIVQAYAVAQRHFVKGGVNRVVLCTDGDFNVGVSDAGSLVRLAREKANPESGDGVFLSTCGFGRGNLNDAMMEQVADAGNGNYSYIDSLKEAEKVFVKQAGGTLVAIAKDVKLQVEFNPAVVGEYRLVGYENRVLKSEDFNDDKVDAGDIGAGHAVTALYEIAPAGPDAAKAQAAAGKAVDPLVYQGARGPADKAARGELATLKLRHKLPTAKAVDGTSRLQAFAIKDAATAFGDAGADTRFAAAVAAYGMILRQSEFKGDASLAWVARTAQGAVGGGADAKAKERDAERREFAELVRQAAKIGRGE